MRIPPIEALNTELDPQNIVTSARVWNSPKRTLDYYSTIAIRAKKPKTKRSPESKGSEHYLWELIKKSISNSVATGLNTPGWIDFCDSVEADLGAADESESESVAVGWSPSNNSDKIPVDAADTLQGDPVTLVSEPYKLAVNKLVRQAWEKYRKVK
ncbi:hypothetical protein B0H14DRAFT_2655647 [Mycena olivaceomarginata]|nr:hypothetical protein B0H14DRAFT_2655647 [Mycena olivaceomarginata]